MKIADVRNLGIDELQEKVSQLKKNLMQFRFQAKTGKLETKNSLKLTRRDIARLLTVIQEQKAAGVEVQAPVKAKTVKPAAVKKETAKKTVKKTPVKSSK